MSQQQQTSIDQCYKNIYSAASKARIVVFSEQAYDIIDEISRASSDLNKVLHSLEKLSRLAAKVINDLPDLKDKKANNDSEKQLIDNVYRNLTYWATDVQKLIECFRTADPKELGRMVNAFTTLAVGPDGDALTIRDIKQR